jgi:hypothetical protein
MRIRDQVAMSTYSPITDADLVRARNDPRFREQLLRQSLDALLAELAKLHSAASSSRAGASTKQVREGVELAVQLAELIQTPNNRRHRS